MPAYPTAQESADWLLCRRHMDRWSRRLGYEPAKHHQLVIEKLESVCRGEIKRLMIFMPPGSAKSTYASILFPPHYIGRHPGSCVIAASHTQELADSFGRRVRNIVEEWGPLLGYRLSADSQAAGRWSTTNGSEYFAVGIGGSITGRRADLALIDDPVRSADDADSKLVRDRQWDWYQFDLMTRLKPNASIVLIQTRWHEDDLAGRILASEGEKWEVLRLPMVAEEADVLGRAVGEPLWPDYFTDEMRAQAKRNTRVWSALYQQRPSPEEGGFFKRDWIKGYQPDELPKQLRFYAASDHAVSLKQSADLTCLMPVGVDPAGVVWVLPDVVWDRLDGQQQVESMLKIMRSRKPLVWWAESGHISKSVGPFLTARMKEERAYFIVDEVIPAKDKRTRAQSIAARMSMGMVRFPKFAPWWEKAETEMLAFDTGTHDDFVDALAHVGMGLDRMQPAEGLQVRDIPKKGTLAWHTYGQNKPPEHAPAAWWKG